MNMDIQLRYKHVEAPSNILQRVNNVIQNPSNKEEILIAGNCDWFKVIYGYNIITGKYHPHSVDCGIYSKNPNYHLQLYGDESNDDLDVTKSYYQIAEGVKPNTLFVLGSFNPGHVHASYFAIINTKTWKLQDTPLNSSISKSCKIQIFQKQRIITLQGAVIRFKNYIFTFGGVYSNLMEIRILHVTNSGKMTIVKIVPLTTNYFGFNDAFILDTGINKVIRLVCFHG